MICRTSHTTALADSEDATACPRPPHSVRLALVKHALDELVNWAQGRYKSIAKDYERFDESWADGFTVVYCSGTLRGVWLDGSNFEGVRFIDRFDIADGKIRRQDVWNDLAETLAHRPA